MEQMMKYVIVSHKQKIQCCYGVTITLLLWLSTTARVSFCIGRAINRLTQTRRVGTVALVVLWPCLHQANQKLHHCPAFAT